MDDQDHEKQDAIEALKNAHSVLHGAMESVLTLSPVRFTGSADTAFAMGEAAGMLSKAKALVGRDLDDLLARTQSTSLEAAPL